MTTYRQARGFTRIQPTPNEVVAYRASHRGHDPAVYRVQCDTCGKRIWGSGFGIGSHRRADCTPNPTLKGTPA